MNTKEAQLTVTRHELKYYLSYSDYIVARNILRELMDRDAYSPEEGYPIRSLYFDDIQDASVIEKLDGIELRDKYRLRTYDPKLDWVKLERKSKNNNYVQKTSVRLAKEEAKELIGGNSDVLLSIDTPGARSMYFDFKRKYLRPVVVIDYVREAYTLPFNNIRITFDKTLRYATHNLNLFDEHLETIPLQGEDIIILEIKFDNFLPPMIRDMLPLQSATSSAISKYTQSRITQMDSWWGLQA